MDETLFTKPYMKYLHILIEIVCFLIIIIYIFRMTRKLQNQISDLMIIIEKQQKIIHEHSKLFDYLNKKFDLVEQQSSPQITDPFVSLFTIQSNLKPFATSSSATVISDESVPEKIISKNIIPNNIPDIIPNNVPDIIPNTPDIISNNIPDNPGIIDQKTVQEELKNEIEELKNEEKKQIENKKNE